MNRGTDFPFKSSDFDGKYRSLVEREKINVVKKGKEQ